MTFVRNLLLFYLFFFLWRPRHMQMPIKYYKSYFFSRNRYEKFSHVLSVFCTARAFKQQPQSNKLVILLLNKLNCVTPILPS